jgi:hypothetical protein
MSKKMKDLFIPSTGLWAVDEYGRLTFAGWKIRGLAKGHIYSVVCIFSV